MRSIGFHSYTVDSVEKNYPAHGKEMIAIKNANLLLLVESICLLGVIIMGFHFMIV
jgi:hypothetical protein